jgi:TonB family protein
MLRCTHTQTSLRLLLFCVVIMGIFATSACSISITDSKYDTPDAYDFVPVEKEPYIDLKLLQAAILYPPEARRLGIEGKVNVRVLVGKTGIPKNYLVESTDSPLLIAEAVRVVMNATFSPAIQNNQPIDCWVSIPIIFKL